MTHPAPLAADAAPGADVPHVRLGTARSTKLNNWLTTHVSEIAKHSYAELAEMASADLGLAINRGHINYRVDELRQAGDLPPKASEAVQPAPLGAPVAVVPGPQLTLVSDTPAPGPQEPQGSQEQALTKVNLPASLASLRTAQREEIARRLDACNARRETLGVLAGLLSGEDGERRSNLAIVQQMLDAMDAMDAKDAR